MSKNPEAWDCIRFLIPPMVEVTSEQLRFVTKQEKITPLQDCYGKKHLSLSNTEQSLEWSTGVSVTSQCVLRSVKRVQTPVLTVPPPRFSNIIYSQATGGAARFLKQRRPLREKGATEVAPPVQSQSGFYSRYIVVPKTGGGM